MARDALVGAGGLPLSADILRGLLASSQDVLYAVALDPVHMLYATPAFARRMGLPEDFLARGYDFDEYLTSVHPDDQGRVARTMAAIVASRSDAELPENPACYRLRTPGNRWRSISDSYSVLRNPDGVPHTLIGNAHDVSEQSEARQALAEREAQFRSLAENSRDIFFSFRLPEGRYEFISSNVADIFGHTPQEFYDDPGLFLRCVAPAWRQTMAGWMAENAQGVVRERYEFQVLDKGGRLRWIVERLVLVPAPDGQGLLLQGVVADITEEREAREALRASEAHFRQLIEAWPEQVMLSVNLTAGRHEYVSPSMERVLGYAPQEFYDDPGLGMRVVAPQWQEEAWEWIGELRRGILRPAYEFQLVHKNGEHRWVQQVGALRPRAPGQDLVVQFTFRDITEEHEAREALRASQAFLECIIEQSPMSMWISDEHGTLIRTNQALRRLFQVTEEEVVGRYNIFRDGQLEENGFLPQIRQIFEQGGTTRLILPYDTARIEGLALEKTSAAYLHATISAVQDAQGATTNLIIQHLDITEQKRVEAALRESEALLEAMLRNLPFDFWARDMQQRIVMQSDESVRLWGDLMQKTLTGEHFDGQTLELWRANNRRVLEGEIVSEEHALVIQSGELREFHNIVAPIRDGESVLGLIGVNIDITEQKRAEAALRESEERFRELVEGTQSLITQVDGAGRFTYVNPMVRLVLGLEPEDCIGRLAFEIIYPDDREPTMAAFQGWVADRLTHVTYENRLISVSGEVRHFSWSIRFHYDSNGGVTVIDSIARDITDQKRAETALRESEESFRLIVETASEGIWTVDAEERATFVNAAMAKMLGYTVQEMLGVKTETFLLPEDLESHARRMELRRAGQDETYERRFLRKDGTVLWTLASAKPLLDYSGRFGGAFAMFVDITERKRAEEALQETNALYALLANNVVDVIWTTDAAMRWTYISPSAEILSGRPLDRLMRMGFEELFTSESMGLIHETMARRKKALTREEQDEAYRMEMDLRHADGSLVPLEVLARPMRGANGETSGYCGTSRDITERRRAEAALLASERRFSELIRYSSDSITILDKDGNQVFVSEAVERMLGFKASELMGIPVIEEMLHPDDRERVAAAFAAILKDGMGGAQYRHKHKNGSWVYLEAWGTNPLENPDIRGVVVNVRDITERRQAEAALRLSEARYALALKGANDGIWDWDLVENQVYYSDRWKEIIGYAPDELKHDAQECISRIHPEDLDQVMAANERCMQGETPIFQVEYRLRHKNGTYRWIFRRGAALAEASGRVVRMAGAHTDITGRKQAEEALYKSERLSRKLLESMHEGIWAVDADRRTTFVNDRLCAMLGYAPAELMTMSPMDVLEWPQRHVAESRIPDLVEGYTGATDYVLIRKDGSRFPAHVVSSPVMEEQGRFEGLVCGVVDLTERARMEHDLRRNQARFEALYELSRLAPATEYQLAAFTLHEAIRLTESTAGVLFFTSEDGQALVPKAWVTGELIDEGQMPSLPVRGPLPWATVQQSGLPLLINDFSQCAHLVPPGHPAVTRFLGVPALDGSTSVAVLGLTGKEEPYTAEDTLQTTLLLDGMWREVRSRRDAERIGASLREKEALLHEVHHRVKNNLQVISSLMDMAGRRLSSQEARLSLSELRNKVQAMSLIHAQLRGSGGNGGISLEPFVRALHHQLREVYAGGLELSLWLELGELTLSLDQAVPLGLALNETLANVFKHACHPHLDGTARSSRVEIRAAREVTGRVSIEIEDNGPGLPEGFSTDHAQSLGMKLMKGLVRHQLRGELLFMDADPGVCVCIRFQPHVAG